MFSIVGRSRNDKSFLIMKMKTNKNRLQKTIGETNTDPLDLYDHSSDMALDRILMVPFDSGSRPS